MRLFNSLKCCRGLDVVILGASGFTGRLIAGQFANTLSKNLTSKPIKWGIAGRNGSKLSQILNQISKQINSDLSNVSIIETDINNSTSLRNMCNSCKLVINCVGPYRFFGHKVVDACVTCGTHHIDISGEPQYLETINLEYGDIAHSNKVCIVGSCGFDSIPCDLGVKYLKDNFEGTLNSVESYLRLTTSGGSAMASFATWESLVNGYANRKQLSQLKSKLFSKFFKSYYWSHRIKRNTVFINEFGYCVPFPGSDRSVVIRSQLYNYTKFDERPVQIETYITVKTFLTILKLIMAHIGISLLSLSSSGVNALLHYSSLFSGGIFAKNIQPDIKLFDKNRFELILIGKGWDETYVNTNFQPSKITNKTMITKVWSDMEPAYICTSIIVTQVALTLIEQFHNNTLRYGVLTPSVAFAQTPLIDRLHQNGIKFEIIKS